MRKLAKLSLVTAVAVAGLTNVNAASLEEAIKGVDVSGQFRFRAQEKSAAGTDGTDVEIEVGVKVPVTENVTAVFKIDNANDDTESVTKGDVTIEDYYFSYNQGALTVNAGQQNIPGRMTDGAQGDGLVALYNLGNFTVGAAAFMTNNVSDGSALTAPAVNPLGGTNYADVDQEAVTSVIAMGTVGPVSLLAQYADVNDTLDAYNLKADASIEMVKVGAEYTEVELDAASALEFSTAKAYVGASVGIVSATLSYAKTGDNGSGSIDSFAGSSATSNFSTETPSEFLLWNVGTAGRDDFDMVAIDASVAVTPSISLRAAYLDGEQGTADLDVTEALGQISYKVSKNLTTYVRYADVEDQGSDYTRGRVEARYTF